MIRKLLLASLLMLMLGQCWAQSYPPARNRSVLLIDDGKTSSPALLTEAWFKKVATVFSAPLTFTSPTLSIAKAAGSVDGYLDHSDFATFNAKVGTARTINVVSPLTGGGDLSADRTLSMPAATNSQNGYLTAADHTTFAAGVGAITSGTLAVSAPIAINNSTRKLIGGGATLSMAAATNSVDGYLTAADHTTFNGKQAAGNYITALTGDVTASGPGSAASTIGAKKVLPSMLSLLPIPSKTVIRPKSLYDDGATIIPLWQNHTGATVTLNKIHMKSELNGAVGTLKVMSGTDFTSATTLIAFTVDSAGTSVYYKEYGSGGTALSYNSIGSGKIVAYVPDASSDPHYVFFDFEGYN